MHTLGDEIAPYVVDVSRLFWLAHAITDKVSALEKPHPCLRPENIEIDDAPFVNKTTIELAKGPLSKTAPYAAPETIKSGVVDGASNIYSLGVIFLELLANRPGVFVSLRDTLESCKSEVSAQRPSMVSLRQAFNVLTYQPKHGPWHPSFVPSCEREVYLLHGLLDKPSDSGTRAVYADWLEENGHLDRATSLRDGYVDLKSPDAVSWRALTSRARLTGCEQASCPSTWDAIEVWRSYHNIRYCKSCTKAVHYCGSIEEAIVCGSRKEAAAFDDSLSRADAQVAYETAGTMRLRTWNPPAPRRR